jgi:hypothetical protein
MDIYLTHVHYVSVNLLPFAVSLSNLWFHASNYLRQAQTKQRLVIFGSSICYVRKVDTHYPEFPIPAPE